MEIEATLTEPPIHDGDGYWEYEVEVTLDGISQRVQCWKLASFLERGASSDLDGSGLDNWGSSQEGGWRVLDGDGQDGGKPLARTGAGGVEVFASCDSAWFDLPEATDLEGIAEQLQAALDAVAREASPEEPTPLDIWEELGRWSELEHLPVRGGKPYGSRAVWIAWRDDDGQHHAEEWDGEVPAGLKVVALAKLQEDLDDAARRIRD
jgi:hypothetical protein